MIPTLKTGGAGETSTVEHQTCNAEISMCCFNTKVGCGKHFCENHKARDDYREMPSICRDCKTQYIQAKKKNNCWFFVITFISIVILAAMMLLIL